MHKIMTLDPGELNPTDIQILDHLEEGRCTPSYIADETGYDKGSIRNRLRRLVEHDHVQKVHRGLYELLDDPRDVGESDDDA